MPLADALPDGLLKGALPPTLGARGAGKHVLGHRPDAAQRTFEPPRLGGDRCPVAIALTLPASV
jgi:hypothetical protein